jgi:nicotinamidase-related amidase
MGSLSRFGKLLSQNSALLLCDMQVKFRPTIKNFEEIVHNSNRLLRAANILNIPIVATEQYPKGKHTWAGLGPLLPNRKILVLLYLFYC